MKGRRRQIWILVALLAACGDAGSSAPDGTSPATIPDPAGARAAAERGRALMEQPDSTSDRRTLELATAAFEEALTKDPQNPDYAYWAGCCYISLDRREEAHPLFVRSLELQDTGGTTLPPLAFAEARRYVGEYLYASGDLDGARAELERAVEAGLVRYEVFFALAQVLEDQEELEAARELYERAVLRQPRAPEPYFRLANVLAALGDEEGAAAARVQFDRWSALEEDLRQARLAVSTNPTDAAAYERLAQLLFRVERADEALEKMQLAARYAPDDPGIRSRLGALLLRLGRLGDALFELDAALAIDETSLESHLARAHALAELGRTEDARAALARALELAPEEPRALEALRRLGEKR